jgi:uncharacterized iron-regulated membrane protein
MKGLLSLLIFSMVLPAHAGIVIYGTRIIYPAENKEVMVQLMNQGNRSSLLQAWLSLAWPARSLVLGLAFALGLAMPLMGASLLLFIAVDYLRWRAATAMRMMKSSD